MAKIDSLAFADALMLFARDFPACWVDPGPMYWRPVYEGPPDAPIDDPARHPEIFAPHEWVPTGISHLVLLRLERTEWLALLRKRWEGCRSYCEKRFWPEVDGLLEQADRMLVQQSLCTFNDAERFADSMRNVARGIELAFSGPSAGSDSGDQPILGRRKTDRVRAMEKAAVDGADANALVERFGITASNARQIRSRALANRDK